MKSTAQHGDQCLIPKVRSQRQKISKDHRFIMLKTLKSKTRLTAAGAAVVCFNTPSVDLALEGHCAVSTQHSLKIHKWKPKTEGAK